MPDSAITRSRQTAGLSAKTFRRPLDPHYGPLTSMTISDDGGLNISWAGGQLRTPAGNTITIEPGSATCTDNAINHLKWVSGTALTLTTVPGVHGVEICIGHVACQNGDIWEVGTEPPMRDILPDIQNGLEAIFPLAVASGCLVSEDTDATDPLDVTVSAGAYYHDLHDVHVIAAFDTRTANTLIRCFIDGSGPETWDFTADGAQSEIDVGNWNSGTSLIGTSVGKYYKGLLLVSEDNVFWIYAQEQHNTVAAAIDGALPTIPAGLALFPRSVSYVYKHGDAALEAATSDRWEDVRPVIAGSIAAGPITDHGNLIGLNDPTDHAWALLIDGSRELSANWDAGSHKITSEQLESNVSFPIVPLIIVSAARVANLNADLLDGIHASAFMQDLIDDTTPELGGNLVVGANYLDWTEIAAPGDPAANIARMYCKDDGGTTKLFFRDSAGAETEMGGTGGGGSGDVTAAANMGDHEIIRGDGGAKGVQDSGAVIDDSGNLGLGQATPAARLHVEETGTVKTNLDIMQLVNPVNAADMDGTRTSILWRLARVSDTLLDAGRIGFEAADDWTATGSTQDADFVIEQLEQGVMTEKFRISADPNGGFATFFARIDSRRGDGVSNPFRIFSYADAEGLAPAFSMRRARGTFASPTAVVSGTKIGEIGFRGYDGTSHQPRANVSSHCDGTVVDGSNTVPMNLEFRTGTTSAIGRLTIDSSGDVTLDTEGSRINFFDVNHYIAQATGTLEYACSFGIGHRFRVQGDVVVEFDTDIIRLNGGGSAGSIRWAGAYISLFQTATEKQRITATAVQFANPLLIGSVSTAPATSAILELKSTTGALLLPRMTLGQRGSLTAANGMVIYNTTANDYNFYRNGSWQKITNWSAA